MSTLPRHLSESRLHWRNIDISFVSMSGISSIELQSSWETSNGAHGAIYIIEITRNKTREIESILLGMVRLCICCKKLWAMTMPLCLLCLDFLLCKQQKTTNNLPFLHLFYGESLKIMQYMLCEMALWGCRDVCSLLWVSPYKRVLLYWLTRKVLETNCIYPLLLF